MNYYRRRQKSKTYPSENVNKITRSIQNNFLNVAYGRNVPCLPPSILKAPRATNGWGTSSRQGPFGRNLRCAVPRLVLYKTPHPRPRANTELQDEPKQHKFRRPRRRSSGGGGASRRGGEPDTQKALGQYENIENI